MHLHDALRLWRSEIISETPQVALPLDDVGALPPSLLDGLPRESLPGALRRDDRASVQAILVPAEHRAARPAGEAALDSMERRLGVDLPRSVELLLSLHDGGDFFSPTLPGLPDELAAPLHLLSCEEMETTYAAMLDRMRRAMLEQEPDEDDLFRLARRFGVSRDDAGRFADRLGAVAGGADQGLAILPLARVGPTGDLITLVPAAGRSGRVGHAYAVSGFLPEHSDEFPFDGLGAWLEALVRAKGCRRVIT